MKSSGSNSELRFRRIPKFGVFQRWFSGSSHNFIIKHTQDGSLIRYVDRGGSAALLWLPLAVLPALGAVAYYVVMQSLGYRPDMALVVVPGVIALLCLYRSVRILSRQSILTIDLKTAQVVWRESWPTSRHLSAPLTQTSWVVQPVRLTDNMRFSWKGYLLRVEVAGQSFVLAAKKEPLQLREAIPSELRKTVSIHFLRDEVLSPTPF